MAKHGIARVSRPWLKMAGLVIAITALSVHANSPSPPPSESPPPPGPSLQTRYPGLSLGIERGDPVAMCELALALDRCETYAKRLVELKDYLQLRNKAFASSDNPQTAAAASHDDALLRARLEPNLLAWAASCAHVPAYGAGQRIALWGEAAKAGNRTALAMYASGAVFRGDGSFGSAQLESQVERYRVEAETLALLAARRGVVSVAAALASAYAPSDPPEVQGLLSQSVQRDRVKAVALSARVATAMQALPADRANWFRRNFSNFQLQRLRSGLSPEDAARADALGRQWQQAWAPMDVSPAGLATFWSADEATALAQTDCSH